MDTAPTFRPLPAVDRPSACCQDSCCAAEPTTTILRHNTHLAMQLGQIGFADPNAVLRLSRVWPWRARRASLPLARRGLLG